MRARFLIFSFLVAVIAGCSDSQQDDHAASPDIGTQRPSRGPEPQGERLVDQGRPAAPRTVMQQRDQRPQDIRSLHPIPTDDDVPLDLHPLEAPADARDPDSELPGRTALAPPQALAPRATASRRSADAPFATIRVFYGTNRAETGSKNPKEVYGSRRDDTSFGFCDVSIPHNHEVGHLESPSIWRFEFREDPRRHVVLLNVLKRGRSQFLSALQQEVWSSMEVIDTPDGPALAGGEVFVFVHGYNNTFEDAARRAAQIAHDLKFAGAPVMYSWPSQAKSSLDGYRTDGQMAGWSEEHLIDFVSMVARDSGARRVHLIAHSMGNRIVSGALRRLVEQCNSGRIPRFNEVILSAPDVDADYFKTAIAPRIIHSADRITIYSSSRDYALKMSSFFNPMARKRLGEAGDELTVFPNYANIDVIDATEVETDLFSLNHSYHADSPTILSDMQLLMQGYTTEQRGLSSTLDRLAWQIRNTGQQLSEGFAPQRR